MTLAEARNILMKAVATAVEDGTYPGGSRSGNWDKGIPLPYKRADILNSRPEGLLPPPTVVPTPDKQFNWWMAITLSMLAVYLASRCLGLSGRQAISDRLIVAAQLFRERRRRRSGDDDTTGSSSGGDNGTPDYSGLTTQDITGAVDEFVDVNLGTDDDNFGIGSDGPDDYGMEFSRRFCESVVDYLNVPIESNGYLTRAEMLVGVANDGTPLERQDLSFMDTDNDSATTFNAPSILERLALAERSTRRASLAYVVEPQEPMMEDIVVEQPRFAVNVIGGDGKTTVQHLTLDELEALKQAELVNNTVASRIRDERGPSELAVRLTEAEIKTQESATRMNIIAGDNTQTRAERWTQFGVSTSATLAATGLQTFAISRAIRPVRAITAAGSVIPNVASARSGVNIGTGGSPLGGAIIPKTNINALRLSKFSGASTSGLP